MRKNGWYKSVIALAVFLVIGLLAATGALADGDKQYDAARSMLSLINSFRTGGDAWYWDSDDTTKTYASGLKALEYDYDLEKTAMERAAELAISFSHTRPDGSKWSSAFPSGNFYKGENIAYGYGSAESAFTAFLEEDEDYDGQGHRRNMLRKEFTRVGIGCVKVGNTVYWAQAFASGKAGGSPTEEEDSATETGWVQNGNSYSFYMNDGSKATGWLQDAGTWYYFDSKGIMQTGWLQIQGQWYYFKNSGAMATGWVTINGQKEFFNDSGIWLYSEEPETIEDYDTPLGTGDPGQQLLRLIVQMLLQLLSGLQQ